MNDRQAAATEESVKKAEAAISKLEASAIELRTMIKAIMINIFLTLVSRLLRCPAYEVNSEFEAGIVVVFIRPGICNVKIQPISTEDIIKEYHQEDIEKEPKNETQNS
jgi:hypothetical protein